MKLVTYSEQKTPLKTRPALLWGEWILDIHDLPRVSTPLDIRVPPPAQSLSEKASSILDVLARGPKVLDDLQKLSWRIFNRIDPEKIPRTMKKLSQVRIRSPITRPPTLRDFYAFEDHVKTARARRGLQMPEEWYELPAFYYSNPTMIYGPDDEIPIPPYTKKLDYELEVACVIGKGGTNILEKEAETHIAGYMIMNDWSARDIQEREVKIGLGPAKAKDFATSLGPWLVTPDELQDKKTGPAKFDLRMKATVNGKPLSNGNMKMMHWTFSQMIARASQSVELKAGEVFGSGTVGTGSLLELGQEVHPWLKPGDRVELEVERLGVLRNRIIETANS
jgi:2-keto-4-pentenoate hydratase/2-oxohepta-3-ene-1,7-dioic acid hydratase in catechol pathway